MHEQGRKYHWLARETGYSESTVGAIVRGERRGSIAFYKLASTALGRDVAPR